MGKNETCKPLCEVKYTEKSVQFVKSRIEQGYSLEWLVDGLPAGQEVLDQLTGTTFYNPRFLLGQDDKDDNILFNNHYEIAVETPTSAVSLVWLCSQVQRSTAAKLIAPTTRPSFCPEANSMLPSATA
ncbi:hypothetical protein LB505_004864 [Fusarium chuoi]|nr:hypothetical protein LB505_004864 [Fusarium chuoi]